MPTSNLYGDIELSFSHRTFVPMIWFVVPMLLFLYLFAHPLIVQRIRMHYWSKGQVPPRFSDTDEHRNLLFTALAGLLVRQGEIEKHPNLELLHGSLLRQRYSKLPPSDRKSHFLSMKSSLRFFAARPVQIPSVKDWLDRQAVTDTQKETLVRILVSFAMQGGNIQPHALQNLEKIAHAFGIDLPKLQEIIATGREKERRQQQQKHRDHARPETLERSFTTLGLTSDAEPGEIRKAYRKLAQRYHPDKFATASAQEQENAKKRFLEIRKAYEILEKIR